MRFILVEELSTYDAFRHYGCAGGDSPFAHLVLEEAMEECSQAGYRPLLASGGLHNDHIYALQDETTAKITDLDEVARNGGLDLEEDPRQVLLAAGLQDLVAELDRRDQKVLGDRPAAVVLRHPGTGAVVDLQLFSSTSAARAFAAERLAEGDDVELLAPDDGRSYSSDFHFGEEDEEKEVRG